MFHVDLDPSLLLTAIKYDILYNVYFACSEKVVRPRPEGAAEVEDGFFESMRSRRSSRVRVAAAALGPSQRLFRKSRGVASDHPQVV